MNKSDKFENYAFTIATVLFFAFMIFGIFIASLSDSFASLHRWWPFSWMFFMFAWSACLVKDVIDIKYSTKDACDKLEGAAETALYVCITTAMLVVGIITGQMYSSWLAGPITLVLLTVIWPILRNTKSGETHFPAIPLLLLLVGIIIEVVMGGWVALPVSWIVICAVKVYGLIRKHKLTEDILLDILYYTFSIIFISIGLFWKLWIISWLGYPLAVIISKVICRIKKTDTSL